MAHGTPDWAVTAGAATTYQLTDLGELAARLGSIDTFDRRGDVIAFEDFESDFVRWSTSLVGTGAFAGLSTKKARSGSCALRLVPGSTGGRLATATRRQNYPVAGRIGLEFHLCNDDGDGRVRASMAFVNATSYKQFEVRLDLTAGTASYLNAAAGYTVFASSLNFGSGTNLFHPIKLVVDAATGLYVRALIQDQAFDLSTISGYTPAASGTPALTVDLEHQGIAATNRVVYIDDVIVTQNEPA